MGLITTQVLGFGQPKPTPEQKADPKPVRGLDWLGHPMKEGDFYNGRPENMAPTGPGPKGGRPTNEQLAHPLHVPIKKQNRGGGKGRFPRSAEFREQARKKMQAWWANKKAQQSGSETG